MSAPRSTRPSRLTPIIASVALLSAACGADPATLLGPASPPVTGGPSADACVDRVIDAMTLDQRAGQVLMVGVDSNDDSPGRGLVRLVRERHVGSVFLTGRSSSGSAAIRALSTAIQDLTHDGATAGVGMHVAVDQEGGQVQVLRGPGFSDLPTAIEQGALPTTGLRELAEDLGSELAAAGITMNLAPVADVVPESIENDPIGRYDRHYGSTPAAAAAAVATVVEGLLAAGVVPVIKHFPGLGRASGNTDTTSEVTDNLTTSRGAFLEPFRAGIAAGAPVVMTSTARYQRVDPAALAAFSPLVTDLLRRDLGFDGVIMTDDLGKADSVAAIPVADRAIGALSDGADLIIVFETRQAATMADALVARAATDRAFEARLTSAATRVVAGKAEAGLVSACP